MKKLILMTLLTVGVAGCSGKPLGLFGGKGAGAPSNAQSPDENTPRPVPRDGETAAAPPEDAVTVEDFDTTTSAERAAAVEGAADDQTGVPLGKTIATLGSPARPGFWLETPLVRRQAKGRVVAASGKSVLVDLIPLDAPTGTGSRISLAALRLLGEGLGGLHELQVFRF